MSCVEVKTERKNGIYLLSGREDGINVKAEGVNLVYASINRLGGVGLQTERKNGVNFVCAYISPLSGVNVRATRKNGIYLLPIRENGVNVKAENMHPIRASIDRLGGVGKKTKRKGGVSLSIGLICEIDVGKYMRVTPKETQWINVDMSIDYNVFSNVEWELV